MKLKMLWNNCQIILIRGCGWAALLTCMQADSLLSLNTNTRWDWTNKAISSDQVLFKSLWKQYRITFINISIWKSHSTSNCRSKIIKHLYIHNFKSNDKFQISFLLKCSKISQRMLKYVPKHTKQQIIAYNKKGQQAWKKKTYV